MVVIGYKRGLLKKRGEGLKRREFLRIRIRCRRNREVIVRYLYLRGSDEIAGMERRRWCGVLYIDFLEGGVR